MKRKRPGRRRVHDVKGWGSIPNRQPEELVEALKEYCHRRRVAQSAVIRELLEQLLQKSGYLRVELRYDSETGQPIATYQVLEGPRKGATE